MFLTPADPLSLPTVIQKAPLLGIVSVTRTLSNVAGYKEDFEDK